MMYTVVYQIICHLIKHQNHTDKHNLYNIPLAFAIFMRCALMMSSHILHTFLS